MIKTVRGQLWLIVWWFARKFILSLYAVQCPGSAPAACWVPESAPHAGDGYYRYGIMRQYCVLSRWHSKSCLARIDAYGDRNWTYFMSGKVWNA